MIEEGILNDSVGPSSEGSTNGIRRRPASTTSVPSFLQLWGVHSLDPVGRAVPIMSRRILSLTRNAIAIYLYFSKVYYQL